MRITTLFLSLLCLICMHTTNAQPNIQLEQNDPRSLNPVRIGIDGLSHDHVHGLLNDYKKRSDILIVGTAEPNKKRAQELAKRYGFDMSIVYDDLLTMVDKTNPEGVVAFNSIYEHLKTVEVCAPRGIHVMVEKPLAVSNEHAKKME
ncbi:MAG: Gfo/Idh/MocA family oxidoreductase, partial [Fermentimonas sp.]|nr:Gfo/Idh/MocA family oxidoreductase [Fermentimonas sp.]